MVHRYTLMSLMLGLICCLPMALADDEKKESTVKPADKAEKGDKEEAKFTAKCPVSGEAAVKEQSAAYKEKEVYFCCDKCKATFEADNTKFAEKANQQLVQTRQFTQVKCPLSGGDLNKEQFTKVGGAKVTFCCEKCKGAIEAATKEEQLTKIFSEKVFTKAFAAREEKGDDEKKAASAKEETKFTATCPVSGEAAVKEQFAGYKEKEVYFCCEKCKAAFEADTKKFAEKANQQLVQTKQFKQTKCPLSGGDLNKEQFAKVGGVKVTFCCEKCKGAIEAASKEEQLTKIFSEAVFTKAFEAKKAKTDDEKKEDGDKKTTGDKKESAKK